MNQMVKRKKRKELYQAPVASLTLVILVLLI